MDHVARSSAHCSGSRRQHLNPLTSLKRVSRLPGQDLWGRKPPIPLQPLRGDSWAAQQARGHTRHPFRGRPTESHRAYSMNMGLNNYRLVSTGRRYYRDFPHSAVSRVDLAHCRPALTELPSRAFLSGSEQPTTNVATSQSKQRSLAPDKTGCRAANGNRHHRIQISNNQKRSCTRLPAGPM